MTQCFVSGVKDAARKLAFSIATSYTGCSLVWTAGLGDLLTSL